MKKVVRNLMVIFVVLAFIKTGFCFLIQDNAGKGIIDSQLNLDNYSSSSERGNLSLFSAYLTDDSPTQITIEQFRTEIDSVINELIANQGLDSNQDLGTFGEYLKVFDLVLDVSKDEEIFKEIKEFYYNSEGRIRRTDTIYKIGNINLTVSDMKDRKVVVIDQPVYPNNSDFRGEIGLVSFLDQKGTMIYSGISKKKQQDGEIIYEMMNDSFISRFFGYGEEEPKKPIPIENIEFSSIGVDELRKEILTLRKDLIERQGLSESQDLGEFKLYVDKLEKVLEDLEEKEIGKLEEEINTFWNNRPIKIKHTIYKIGEQYVEINDSPLAGGRVIKVSNSIFPGDDDLRINLKFTQDAEGTKVSQYVEKKEGDEEVEWVKVEGTQIEKIYLYGETQDRTSTYFKEIKSFLDNLAQLQNAIDERGNYIGKFGEVISELLNWFEDSEDIVKIFDNTISPEGEIHNGYLDKEDGEFLFVSQDKEGNINYVEGSMFPSSGKEYRVQIIVDRGIDKVGVFKTNKEGDDNTEGTVTATRQLFHLGEKDPYEEKSQTVREWKTVTFSEIEKELNSLSEKLLKLQGLSSTENEFGDFVNRVLKGISEMGKDKQIKIITRYHWDGSMRKMYFFERYGLMGWPLDELNVLYSKKGEILAVERAWPDRLENTNERYIIAFSPDNLAVEGVLPEDYENSTIIIHQYWSYFDFDPSSENWYTGELEENSGLIFDSGEGLHQREFLPQEEWFYYWELYNLDIWF